MVCFDIVLSSVYSACCSLSDRNVVKRPLTEDEARFYIGEIVAALEWVHLHGYVYR